MTPAEHAEQRARDYVRDRGWRQEPLSWEEVRALLEALEAAGEFDHDVCDPCDCCAGCRAS